MVAASITFGRGHEMPDSRDFATYLAALEADWDRAVEATLRERQGFRDRLMLDYGPGLDGLQMVHSCAHEAAEWAAQAVAQAIEDDPENSMIEGYYAVIKGLMARGLLAYAEVAWLLRGGFPAGAQTRVRTLHELYVTAAVLARHGHPDAAHPELVERYVHHRRVFIRQDADALLATGVLEPEILDATTLTALEQQRDKLVDRYGQSFKGMWGWAAPLLHHKERPTMAKLGALVAPELNYFYGAASSHVHAGSQGWHENFIEREHETVMAAGPVNVGLSLPSRLASFFLLGMLEIAVPTSIGRDGEVDKTGALFLAGIDEFIERACAALETGESAVEERETAFQRDRRTPSDPT